MWELIILDTASQLPTRTRPPNGRSSNLGRYGQTPDWTALQVAGIRSLDRELAGAIGWFVATSRSHGPQGPRYSSGSREG